MTIENNACTHILQIDDSKDITTLARRKSGYSIKFGKIPLNVTITGFNVNVDVGNYTMLTLQTALSLAYCLENNYKR